MHNLYDCLEFKKMAALERIKFCYDQKICFRCCNSRSHRSDKCPMKSTCSCGSSRHNGLIHLDEEGNKKFGEFVKQRKEERDKEKAKEKEKDSSKGKESTSAVAATNVEVAAQQEAAVAANENRVFNASTKINSKTVFRPVVAIKVINPQNGEARDVMAMLDKGSDSTCLLHKTAVEMGFKREPCDIEMSTGQK